MFWQWLGLMVLPVFSYGQIQDSPAIKSEQAIHSVMLDIAYNSPGERLVAVGDRGHILYSDNQGKNWQQAKVPTQFMLTAVSFPSESTGYAAGHQGVILKTEDAGSRWKKIYTSEHIGDVLLDIWFLDDRHGIAVGSYGMALETFDGGNSWRSVADKIPNPDELHLNVVYQHSGGSLFLAGEKGILFRSDDAGKSWRALKAPYTGSWFGIQSTSYGQLLVYGLRGNIFKSMDLGGTWSSLNLSRNTLFGGSSGKNSPVIIAGDSGTLLLLENDRWLKYQRSDRATLNDAIMTVDQYWITVGERGIKRIKPEFKPLAP